eukprot:m.169270 g.169270  ORF g.169270 m.169270 type:complete len:64 (+) comp16667_c2_seq1:2221-2412(+)
MIHRQMTRILKLLDQSVQDTVEGARLQAGVVTRKINLTKHDNHVQHSQTAFTNTDTLSSVHHG